MPTHVAGIMCAAPLLPCSALTRGPDCIFYMREPCTCMTELKTGTWHIANFGKQRVGTGNVEENKIETD